VRVRSSRSRAVAMTVMRMLGCMAGSVGARDARRERFDQNRMLNMTRFAFNVEDLARTRFAISPIWEAVHSLTALRDPATAAIHVPWLRSLSGRLGGLALDRAVALIPPRGYSPDFLTPPPAGPLGSMEDDLDALRRTPVAQIRRDMALFASQHGRSTLTETWLEHPRREVRRLATTIGEYWKRALEPEWPRIYGFLEADIAHRARRLTEGGAAALFAELHPAVTWGERHVDVTVPRHEATIELAGRGLLLMPSAFQWIRPAVVDLEPWQPTILYPARGIATLWQDAAPAPDGLRRLLGTTRAAALADLGAPRSTTELARRLSISPANASHHLAALRDAGLLTARREGRSVLYVRTPTGDALARGER
jgi:DNA-binding transcriptional ArsR family regulator